MDQANKKKTVQIGKSELKSLFREVLKEMVQSGELTKLIQESVQATPQQMIARSNPQITQLASLAAKNPTQQQMLEGIFADTAAGTLQQQRHAFDPDAQMMYNGYNNQMPSNPNLMYAAQQQYYPQNIPQGYPMPAQGQPIQQPQGYGYIGEGPNNHPQGVPAAQISPLARMAYSRPMKNNLT
jgi:hypothetical protein